MDNHYENLDAPSCLSMLLIIEKPIYDWTRIKE